jgi:hypothetical protein
MRRGAKLYLPHHYDIKSSSLTNLVLIMNRIKNIAFSALLTLGALATITYTACNKDECKDVVCQNGGTCVSGSCSCPTGYEGTNCQNKTRDRFVGTWSGQDVCNSGTYTINLTVATSSSSDVNALISNPGGFGTAVIITGTVSSSNTLTFTGVSVGGGRTLTGTMTFTGGTSTTNPTAMTFAYTVTPTSGSADVCNGTYTKQ